jgi:hypothetical protein
MDLTSTLMMIAGLVGLTVFAGWRGARPPDLQKGPRMIPWRMIMVSSAAFALLFLVHLASLFGLHQTTAY